MNPVARRDKRISDLHKKILDAAYGWSGLAGINVKIEFYGRWNDDRRKIVKDDSDAALADPYKLFSDGKPGKQTITWQLQDVAAR